MRRVRQKLRAIPQPIPLVKLAYKQLRDSIMTFHLKPGQIYNEINLAKEFGISRTPVREALLELSAQGLVTFLTRRGARINHFSKRDVEEVFELRKAIELAVVEKISRRSADLDVAKLERTLDRHIEAIKKGDRLVFLRADRTFHTTLAKLTQNRRLVSILGNEHRRHDSDDGGRGPNATRPNGRGTGRTPECPEVHTADPRGRSQASHGLSLGSKQGSGT